MTQHTRTVLLGLTLTLASHGAAQTMIETVSTIGIQNTLQSTGTPALPNVTVPAAQGATDPTTPTSGTPAPVVTPLTAEQQAQLAQARAAYQANNLTQARTLFEALITQNYTNPDPHFGLALTLVAQNDLRGATFELTQFTALAPTRFEGPYNLGVIAARQGNHDEALRLFTQAATLMKDQASPAASRQVLEALAAEQTRKADFTGLTGTLTALNALDPKDPDVQYRLAQARTLSGQGAAALPGVYTLLQQAPGRVDAALLLADIYVGQSLPDRALRELDAATSRAQTGEGRATLLLRKASILEQTGDTRAAVFAAQAATRQDPKNAAAFAREGELRVLRNDRPGALTAYLNAVKLAPQTASYRAALAAVRLTLGQNADAQRDAALTLTLRPDDATLARALFVQGVAAYRQGRYAQARAALQSSHTRAPSADTVLWLGLSAYAAKDYPAAATALGESVKLNPTPTARLNLSSALLASARYPEAEAVLRGLVSENPKNAEAWYLLGLTQRAQGREAEGRTALKTAATLGNARAQGALK
ncbi:tetratricopeptide repeat protein [Deinococcus taeanensis]|uniref:tetratricopeptide repeat protein n=1 Tax=Deinococcus taeanensis TaxID=2737050 RepID=UPI001CDCD9FD|nr:tetratricopeptide repeat protein [Deinococcus taeanensis]UBV41558.1 tetratricopeptide repeat protein [Deinococcus taeanensis]